MSKAKTIAISAIVAGATGYVVGLLTAPKSGSVTREDIKDAAKQGVESVEKAAKRVQAELATQVEKVKAQAAKLHSGAKEKLEGAVDNATKAKEKVQEVVAAANDDTSDKDLKKAIKEAEKAVESLKKFFSK